MIDESGGNALQTLSIALQALGLGVMLICISLLNISVGAVSVSLMYIPVALLFFWPRYSKFAPSVWVALIIGLLQDLASGGPLGLWTLTYTALFVIIDPTVRRSRGGLSSQWSVFAVLVLASATLTWIFGRLSMGVRPNLTVMGLNAGAVIALFPALFFLRRFIYQVSGRDDVLRGS